MRKLIPKFQTPAKPLIRVWGRENGGAEDESYLGDIEEVQVIGHPYSRQGDRNITHLPSWDVITPDGNGMSHQNVTGLAPRGKLYFDRVGKTSGRIKQVNPEFDMLMLGRQLSTAFGKSAVNKITSTPVSKKALLRSKDKVNFDNVEEVFKYIQENPSTIVSKTTVGELPEETINMINDSYFRYTNQVPKELKNFNWNNLLEGTSYDDRNSILMDELANSQNIVYNVPFSYKRGAPEGFSVGNNQYYHQQFYNPETIGHEVNHTFRDLIGEYMFAKAPTKYGTAYGYFPKEADLLEKAYIFPKEIIEYLENNPTSILKEKGALNYEIRALLSKENNGIIGEELNSVIDKLTVDDIKKKLSQVNSVYSTSDIPISQKNLKYIKNALKIVGATLPIYKHNK